MQRRLAAELSRLGGLNMSSGVAPCSREEAAPPGPPLPTMLEGGYNCLGSSSLCGLSGGAEDERGAIAEDCRGGGVHNEDGCDDDAGHVGQSRRCGVNMTECVSVPSSEHVAEIVGRQGM